MSIITKPTTKERKLNKKNLQEKVRPSGLLKNWFGSCESLHELNERLESEGFFKNV